MKAKTNLVAVGTLLAVVVKAAGQPVITNQPQNQTNIAGTTAMFTVGATGALPLNYQWRSYANATSFTNIPGATEASLMLTNVLPTSRRFGVVVANPEGSVTSVLATLNVLVPPTITAQPTNRAAEAGEAVTFSVAAAGTPTLRYQWRFNGADLPGIINSNLVLSNVQFTNAGNYTVIVTNAAGSVTSQVATLSVAPALFTKITTGPVVTSGGDNPGGAWGDYDNDGDLDLFVPNASANSFLYRNNGDGTFTQVTTGLLATDSSDAAGAVWGDYDNDGGLDLVLARYSSPARLFRNNGDGTFVSVLSSPVTTDFGSSRGCAWADFDQDGHLDLFRSLAEYQGDLLYRNNGNGTFTRITNSPVAKDGAWSMGCDWADYDNDGAPDLFVAASGIYMYRNNGNGVFSGNSFLTARVLLGIGSIRPTLGDYDNDGDLDLFMTGSGYPDGDAISYLFANNGDGFFTKILNRGLSSDGGRSWGAAWGDYDNDGFLDLFAANGGPDGPSAGQNNFLYHNNGDGAFTRITVGRIVNDGGASFGCAWGDYDNDGFLDLFVSNWYGQNDSLYRNNGNTNAWLKLRLVGTASNRAAIGARVRVQATMGGVTRWQLRDVSGGDGYNGQDSLHPHFGLGDATRADLVRIEWPSGIVQELTNVAARQFLNVTETVPAQITIVTQPQSSAILPGDEARLFVRVSGPPPLTYRWQFNGIDLPGATNRLLLITDVQPTNAGSYQVVIGSSGLAPVTSSAAFVTLAEPATLAPHRFKETASLLDHTIRVGLAGETLPGYYDIFPVDASTNLADWVRLTSLVSSNGAAEFADTNAPNVAQRFFRTLSNTFPTPFPKPTGPSPVGVAQRQVSDPSRTNRPLVMSLWYPAEAAAGAQPVLWYEGPFTSRLTGDLGRPASVLSNVYAHAVSGWPVSSRQQNWPVLIFSHGFTGVRAENSDLMEEWASHGYVVIAPNHIDAGVTVQTNGAVVNGSGGLDAATLQDRVRDVRFILDTLNNWSTSDPLLAGRLDLQRIGVAGFSFGGETALEAGRVDARCRAVLDLDGSTVGAVSPGGFNKPAMLIINGSGPETDARRTFYNALRSQAYFLKVLGTEHCSFGCPFRVLAPDLPAGSIDNRRAAQILNAYALAFFNKHLLSQDNHLLDGPSPAFPEVNPFMRK